MFCVKSNLDLCFRSLRQQAELMLEKCKGVDITIKEHKNKRTLPQNRLLWLTYNNIVLFWTQTGFMPDNLQNHLKFINAEIIHEWFKCKNNIKTTTKLSTKELSDYIESINKDMIEQTYGEYMPIYPENLIYEES